MNAGPEVKNIVLVHGGFVDGSGWQGVYDHLTADGYRVAVVQNPTLSLAGDVAATHLILDGLDGPAVLVGHSYGGAVITEAGNHPNVAALAYITAFAPDKGESVNSLIADFPADGPQPPILPPNNGFLFLDRDKFAAHRSPVTCPPRRRRSWPTPRSPGASTRSAAPSPNRPGGPSRRWYLLVSDDHMIPPPAQRAMAERAGRHRQRGPGEPRHLRVQPRRRRRRHRPGGNSPRRAVAGTPVFARHRLARRPRPGETPFHVRPSPSRNH